MKKARTPIPHLNKIRSKLQQEVNSICPFCPSKDIEHFQIHHIDENPSNHEFENLILVCPTCHSKITKQDISIEKVKDFKKNPNKKEIEIASIKLLKNKCSWSEIEGNPMAYELIDSKKSFSPVFSFSVINHSPETKLLTKITLNASHLYSGLSGIPEVYELKTIQEYTISIPDKGKTSTLELDNEIVIPSGRAFKIEIEVVNEISGGSQPIRNRKILEFGFLISNKMISSPNLFLNCKDENEKIEIRCLY